MSKQPPGKMPQTRKLAAIMFTDLVGFSALMDKNEDEAMDTVRKNRTIHQSAIKNHGGQLLKEIGDGMLATFPSALQSVRCAIEIQNKALVQKLELPIRIGLHLGDINIENEDIFGDGVNVASRLQSIADPGGIYFSESIHSAIHNHSDTQSKCLGDIRLKNIAEPVRIFALQTEGLPMPSTKRLAPFLIKKPSDTKVYRNAAIGVLLLLAVLVFWFIRTYEFEKIIEHKSIAVLPLEDLSVDQDEDYLSSGMTDALIKELSKASPLIVIAQRSTRVYEGSILPISQIARELNSADYIVKGTVSISDNLLKAEIQLIDPAKDHTLWKQNYEDDISNSIQMWSIVAQDLIRQMDIRVSDEDAVLWKDIQKVNPETYKLYLKGMHNMNIAAIDANIQGMVYLNEAVDKNPADPLAYVGLAYGYVTMGHGPNPRLGDWEKARAASMRAIQLDSTMAEAWSTLADYKSYGENDWEGAEKTFLKANELNPSLPMNHYHYAWYLALFGRIDEAIEEHIRAKELDPLTAVHTSWLGELYVYVGEYDKAIIEAKASMEMDNKVMGLLVLGNAYLGKGMIEEAIKTHEELVKVGGPLGYYWLGPTYLATGRIEDGKKILKELEKNPSPFFTISKAIMYTQLGDFDKAFETLKTKPRHAWFPWIRVFPLLEPLHNDPRFKELMRELNLPDPAPPIYHPELHSSFNNKMRKANP